VSELPPLLGRDIEIALTFGAARAPRDAPLIAASEVGYSPLGPATAGLACRDEIRRVGDSMRDAQHGILLALCECSDDRRFALIQSNRSSSEERRSFYDQRPFGRQDPVWRDFYYLATYTALALIDKHWGSREVVLSHPTGHGWPENLMPTVLEALGHFADREPRPALRHLYIHGCCLGGPDDVLRAMEILNREQEGPQPPRHRAVPWTPVPSPEPTSGCCRLFGVEIPKPLPPHYRT
jgi:hypothetical protein